MRRVWLAIRIFFATLFQADVARQVSELLARRGAAGGMPVEPPAAKPAKVEAKVAPAPARSDAVTLLATLQREARLVDFVQEPLEAYSDAQIGAAARDVHRECGKVLARLFAMRPILAAAEGATVEVPAGFDGGRYRLTGNVTGAAPFHGRLVHHGWEVEKCELPAWSGTAAAARVVAPVEVEL
jgi:hypothetical protein